MTTLDENAQRLQTFKQDVKDYLSKQYGFEVGFQITSEYRDPRQNVAAGGVKNSQHMKYEAVDYIPINKKTGERLPVADVVQTLKNSKLGYDQLIYEYNKKGSEWVHMSVPDANKQARRQVLQGAKEGKLKVIKPSETVNAAKQNTSKSDIFNERVEFAKGLLKKLEAPLSEKNIAFLLSWMDQEGCKANYNPLATTLDYGPNTLFNSAKVRNYETIEQGMEAQARTLKSKYYPTLLAGLRNGSPELAKNGIAETKTYTGQAAYFANIIQGASKYVTNPTVKQSLTQSLAFNHTSPSEVLQANAPGTQQNTKESDPSNTPPTIDPKKSLFQNACSYASFQKTAQEFKHVYTSYSTDALRDKLASSKLATILRNYEISPMIG